MLLAALALASAASAAPTSPHDASTAAAVEVVRAYYVALACHNYRTAHGLWPDGPSVPRLRQGYAKTAWVRVTPLPPFVAEGAAGSAFTEIRVRVDARLRSGARQHFSGSYTLRRVNDVDGSSAAQRHWHIVSGTLRQVPAGA